MQAIRDAFEQKKATRYLVLETLYRRLNGRSGMPINRKGLAEELGLDDETVEDAIDYLVGEGLAKIPTFEGVTITHSGVKEIEGALSEPDRPTKFFPPVSIVHFYSQNNIGSNVQNNIGSQGQFQNATSGSTQTQSVANNDLASLRAFVALLKGRLPGLELPKDDTEEIGSDIATLEAQLASTRPKKGIIKASLESVQRILENAAGDVLASELITKLLPLLAALNVG